MKGRDGLGGSYLRLRLSFAFFLAVFSLLSPVVFAAIPPVEVHLQKLDEKVEPIPMLERFTYEAKKGLLLRNGRPYYWIADGSDLGGVQATPVGLWLAKLQGTSWASVMHSSCFVDADERDGVVHIKPTLNESSFSWLREAIRLGFLTQCPEGFFRPEGRPSLAKQIAKHPELRECIYDHGHHMGADPGSELGLSVLNAKRHPLFSYGDKTGFFLPELNREPGPDPYNERSKKAFREWARAKYGTLEEANSVWKTDFASWNDVILRHTVDAVPDASCYADERKKNNAAINRVRNERTSIREREKREQPELYWDWIMFVQDDTTAATRREFEFARRMAPHSLMGTDVRGHQYSRDNYVSYDPIAVDGMSDVFYVHYSGFKCYDYGGRPFEPGTLHDAICWPLFTCRYFRCNTTKPILNSEDIVYRTVSAAPSAEAMAANDLARFDKGGFSVRRRGDGGGTVTCTFELDARLDNDRADGSSRFYLAGVSPAPFSATVNGKKAGWVGTAGGTYTLDITPLLKFGEPNMLVCSYGAGAVVPDDPGCHILSQDLLGEDGVLGEKQYKSQYWSYLMGGHSGVIVWHWTKGDRLRLWQAAMTKKLEAAAEIALPAVRFKKEKVAFLYGYMGGAGLPAATQNRHHELMDWAGALEFTGHRFDVLGEERFRENASSYPVVVAPDIWCVYDETVESAKKYVREGGTLVVTPGSLGKTFARYRDSGFAAFASGDTGKGRVVVVEKGLGMEALAEKLAPYLPACELDVRFAHSAEFPCVERLLAGDSKRKILYLQNWGGLDQVCEVMLPDECRGWKMTPLEGRFKRTGKRRVAAKVEGSQGVAVCLLSAPGARIPDIGLSAEETARLEHVREIMTFNRPAPDRKRVLFAIDETGHDVAHTGVEVFPHLVEAVRALGAEVDAVPPEKWTDELLSKYAAVVVTEANSMGYWQKLFKNTPSFCDMLIRYVDGGGALFADIWTCRTSCAIATFSELGRKAWGVEAPQGGAIARDDVSYGFGDPRQILTGNVAVHPIADGVRKVQLFALVPLKCSRGSGMQKVVSLPETSSQPGATVMAACESGQGRVAVMADPMAFQPYRITEADNAALLLNTFGWLLREKVTPEQRTKFRRACFWPFAANQMSTNRERKQR